MIRGSSLAVAVLTGLSCAPPSTYGNGATGHLRPPTGGSSAGRGAVGTGGSSGAASGSTSGTASGGTASGGTSGADAGCYDLDLGPPLTDCPAGQVEIASTVLGLCPPGPATPVMATQIQDHINPLLVGDSDSCGGFHFCVSPGTQLAMEIEQVNGYASTILATIDAKTSHYYRELPILCSDLIAAIAAGYPNTGTGVASLALVSVLVHPVTKISQCADPEGWVFRVTDDLDQPIADAGVIYPSYNIGSPTFTDTATSTLGIAIVFGLDPHLQQVRIHGTNADAGCLEALGKTELTGEVQIAPGIMGMMPFAVDTPDSGVDLPDAGF